VGVWCLTPPSILLQFNIQGRNYQNIKKQEKEQNKTQREREREREREGVGGLEKKNWKPTQLGYFIDHDRGPRNFFQSLVPFY
jgi:hypothetical protein